MNLQLIGNVLIGILLIGWIGYRQTTWRPVALSRMWRMPVIMAVVGAVLLVQSHTVVNGIDIAVLVIELVISLGVGAWMGAIARFRRLDPPKPVGKDGAMALYESRTGWWGLALWLVVIAVRVLIDVYAVHLGAHAATTTGVIVLLLAANRVSRVAVFAARLDRHRAASIGSAPAPSQPVA
jgi:hypothetical protein